MGFALGPGLSTGQFPASDDAGGQKAKDPCLQGPAAAGLSFFRA